ISDTPEPRYSKRSRARLADESCPIRDRFSRERLAERRDGSLDDCDQREYCLSICNVMRSQIDSHDHTVGCLGDFNVVQPFRDSPRIRDEEGRSVSIPIDTLHWHGVRGGQRRIRLDHRRKHELLRSEEAMKRLTIDQAELRKRKL